MHDGCEGACRFSGPALLAWVIKNHISVGQRGAELLRTKFGLSAVEERGQGYGDAKSISPQKALGLSDVSCIWISKPSMNVVVETGAGRYRVRFSEFDRYFLIEGQPPPAT